MDTGGEHSEQQTKQSRWGFRGMTVRDWLDLLVVPLALVVIGFLFSVQQDARQQRIEDQRTQQAQKLESQRAAAERELAAQSAQDEALQSYLDQMSTLLLEKDLRSSDNDSEVRTLARARTLTVLGRLDPTRKSAVMQFLEEAALIQRVAGREPIIRLNGADLNDVDLSNADLSGAELDDADLRETNMHYADLDDADLSYADLREANMLSAFLKDVDLSFAVLNEATLCSAQMEDADLFNADLKKSNLCNVDLGGAFLYDADLSKADLSGAELKEAFWEDTDLTNADLREAERMTEEQLAQAKSLKGATMPNGQKYEDWRKDR